MALVLRPLLVTTLCALSLPLSAFAQTAPSSSTDTAAGSNCSCDQVCAEHAQQEARARAARRQARARAQQPPLAVMHVDTRISREVAQGCQYTANVRGDYRARDVTGRAGATVRDVDVNAEAQLTCGGEVVRRTAQRFVFPRTTREHLVEVLHARLGTQVPGSECTWGAVHQFRGGNLSSHAVEGNCSRPASLAATYGYGAQPGEGVASSQGGSTPVRETPPSSSARGGGPALEPTADDARYGAH